MVIPTTCFSSSGNVGNTYQEFWGFVLTTGGFQVKDKLFILVLDDVWTEDSNQWGPFKLALDGGAPGLDGKIFRLWTCLRSLDLSNNYDLCELPNEIGDLIHLRYLDLSMTSVWKLPNSLSNLCNLQTLKLNGCQFICELPASMGNMISLRHLEIYNTERLRFLPEGIERLASLRSLSKFIVSKGRKLGDLKGLNLIQGSIEISGLRRVKSANEAKEVQLASKRGIHALTLDFGLANELENISEVDKERMEGVLEGLQPHPNLEKLKINQYPGSKLPSWMILFSELRVLELKYLTQCTTLLSLGRLPLLEVLRIDGMISVRRLGLDFLGISDIEEENDDATSSINKEKLVVFPNLIKLHIMEMSELEEWVLPFERSDDTLQIMPRLQILDIWSSPKLKALPALGRLESLEELDISGLDSLQRIGPEFFGISEDDVTRCGSSRGGESVPIIVFPKLKTLDFSFISELEEWEMMMPSWREDVSFIMPCLKELRLGFCKKLKVVPHNIFSYQPVKERIEFCSELNKRSRRNQIIIRREVGERGDHSDDDDFTPITPTKSLQGELITSFLEMSIGTSLFVQQSSRMGEPEKP
ncbi:hypothetical protein GIB67_022187 [Kingdonia uniflora]|uniref:R13L1/DRL21-like LRR repeat region domain-containing protein n=1 Tax=Kingdonia uniflora TaxID=39325 RepID=A0A7J7MW67_9MAGN|nr:hypothetical protein GIB67_022187 [Kingdonia uniflora]